MKQLLLLRHAKAAAASPAIEDHERALTPRGQKDAPVMGEYLAHKKYFPDLILSSTAIRALRTAELVAGSLPRTPRIAPIDGLYLAEPGEMLAIIRAAPEAVKTLLLVGHNPGMEQLAALLSRTPVKRKEQDRFDLIEEKFPTAALAVLDFSASRWRDITIGQGELIDFIRPRDL